MAPSSLSLCLAFLCSGVLLFKALRPEILTYWEQHCVNSSALLAGRVRAVIARVRPGTHLIYPYSAYYDDSSSPPRYRIAVTSKCLFENTETSILSRGTVEPAVVKYTSGDYCPHQWVSAYAWQSLEITSIANERAESIDLVVNGTRAVTLPVVPRVQAPELGKVEVCVTAIYWYDDWPRLILWFEMWRAAHDAHFTIYVKSVSKSVRAVLSYYEKKGVCRVVPWPDMPVDDQHEDANKDVFRLGDPIMQNDCVYRSNAEFGVLLDTDEFIHIKSGERLVDFMRRKMRELPDMGAISFPRVRMQAPALDGTFDAVTQEEISRKIDVERKVSYIPSRIKSISTHSVEELVADYKQYLVDPTEAVVVHFRQNAIAGPNHKNEAKLPVFTATFQSRLRERAHEILGDQLPVYNFGEVIDATNNCYQRLYRQKPGRFTHSRVVPGECREDVAGLEDWIELNATESSRYSVV